MAESWLREAARTNTATRRRIQVDPYEVNLNAPPPYGEALKDSLLFSLLGGGFVAAATFTLIHGDFTREYLYPAASAGFVAALPIGTGVAVWWYRKIGRWINENFEIRKLAARARFDPVYQEQTVEVDRTPDTPPDGLLPIPWGKATVKQSKTNTRRMETVAKAYVTDTDEDGGKTTYTVDVALLQWTWARYIDWKVVAKTRKVDKQGKVIKPERIETSERALTPRPFSLPEYLTLRDWLFSNGQAEWKGKGHNSGWQLRPRTIAVMRNLSTRQAPPSSLFVDMVAEM